MNINTSYRIKPRTSKTNSSIIQIYMEVKVYNNGILDDTITVSTGLTVAKENWDKDKAKGKDITARLINEKLTDLKSKTQDLLSELKIKKIESIQELKAEINNNLKLRVTGKVQRGKVQEQISKLQTYSYEYVLNHKLENETLSKERKRQYKLVLEQVKEHFKDKIPSMDAWTENDFIGLKKFFLNRKIKFVEGRKIKPNTVSTRLSYACAIFTYAVTLKIIPFSPVPSKYTPAFVDGDREVLSEEECLRFIDLDDAGLSKTKQIAKYCLIVQMLTGICYTDLKDLEYENIKETEDGYLSEKKRNKTGKPFKIFLSESGYYHLQKLIDLVKSEEKPVNLPSIDYTNRLYKRFAKNMGITKVVTTYTLRHTFAVNYMNKDGRLEDLQKMLGRRSSSYSKPIK